MRPVRICRFRYVAQCDPLVLVKSAGQSVFVWRAGRKGGRAARGLWVADERRFT
jgi:hypothetical protein